MNGIFCRSVPVRRKHGARLDFSRHSQAAEGGDGGCDRDDRKNGCYCIQPDSSKAFLRFEPLCEDTGLHGMPFQRTSNGALVEYKDHYTSRDESNSTSTRSAPQEQFLSGIIVSRCDEVIGAEIFREAGLRRRGAPLSSRIKRCAPLPCMLLSVVVIGPRTMRLR